MSENLKNLENLEEEKVKIQPCAQPADLPAGRCYIVHSHNRYTKLGKVSEKSVTYFGVALYKNPI